MKKAHVSLRVTPSIWLDDDEFDQLCMSLKKNRVGFDDIAFFSSLVHTPLTLEVLGTYNKLLAKRYEQVRELGFKPGINLLSTMGHHEEDIPHTLHDGFTNFTDINGTIARGVFCPNDPKFKNDFLIPMFAMLAKAKPDFIWLDDDIRWSGHHPAGRGCFCEHCLAQFNQKFGGNFTREQLKEAVDTGTIEERLKVRKQILANNGFSLCNLFRLAATTIHDIDPNIEMGAMDAGMRLGDSADYADQVEALSAGSDLPVRWRPGGGAYTEDHMKAFSDKAMLIGCEAAWLPDSVTNIQSEVESFNYQRLRKSEHTTCLEACMYLGAGLTGTAWNILASEADKVQVYHSLLAAVAEVRPFMDLLVSTNKRIRPAGIYGGWNHDWSATTGLPDGNWVGGSWTLGRMPHFQDVFTAGLPPAFRLKDASMTILVDNGAWAFSDDEIKAILSQGLYCDARTLQILNERGFAKYTGFVTGKVVDEDGREFFLEHPFNQGFTGAIRDCRQSFPWGHETAFELVPQDEKCQKLTSLVNFQKETLLDCIMGTFENELGGRIAISGYYPLRDSLYFSKLTQLKRLFNYLSDNKLPAYVESYHRLTIWARDNGVVTLVNASMDDCENGRLAIKTTSTSATFTTMDMQAQTIKGTPAPNGYVNFDLPTIKPWHIALVNPN